MTRAEEIRQGRGREGRVDKKINIYLLFEWRQNVSLNESVSRQIIEHERTMFSGGQYGLAPAARAAVTKSSKKKRFLSI